MKPKTGYILEEGIASTTHFFHDNELTGHESCFDDYTRRFCFVHTTALGKELGSTRWYTVESAPKWLRKLYEIATHADVNEDSYDA